MIDVMVPLGCGGCVYFAQPDALKGSLVHTLKEVGASMRFIGDAHARQASDRPNGRPTDPIVSPSIPSPSIHPHIPTTHRTVIQVRPAVFFAVPRVWEKMYEAMQEVRKTTPLPLRVVSDTLKKSMKTYVLSTQFGEEEVRPALLPLAEKMFDKVKEKLGLDRARYCATGTCVRE